MWDLFAYISHSMFTLLYPLVNISCSALLLVFVISFSFLDILRWYYCWRRWRPSRSKRIAGSDKLLYTGKVIQLIKHYAMKSGGIDPRLLDLDTSLRWVISFTPRPLYTRERDRGTHWIGGWVGPRAGLDAAEKRKFLILPGLELRPLGRPARSQSLYRQHYPGSLSYYV
jgi:hypothetical protein